MMTAKARGKGLVVPFDESERERPSEEAIRRDDVRSIAHLKMLQSLSGKLSRLNDVAQIGLTISDELRLLIDYHNCRVFLRDDDDLLPVAFRGDLTATGARRSGDAAADQGRPRHHRPRRRDGSSAPRRRRSAARARRADRGNGRDRGVAPRGSAQVRDARDRRDRHLEARSRSVRRRRSPAARGHGRARVGRTRERSPVRGAAARGREREGAARVLARPRRGDGHRRRRRAGDCGDGAHPREPEHVGLAPERRGRGARATRRLPRAHRTDEEASCGSRPSTSSLGSLVASRTPSIRRTTRRSRAFPRAPRVASRSRRSWSRGAGASSPRRSRVKSSHEDRDLELLASIARQTRLALQTAASYESLERTFLSTVEALANALEANDEYTSSHARWITDLALKVGVELGLEPAELKRLELGALFHDIGKIGIPARILAKAGPLTASGAGSSSRPTRSSASGSSRRSSSSARSASSSAARTSTTTAPDIRTISSESRSRSSHGSSLPATPSTP